MPPPVVIESVAFLGRDSAGLLLPSHPVMSMRTMKRVFDAGLFPSSIAAAHPGRDVAIAVTLRRLNPSVRHIELKGGVEKTGPLGNVRAADVSFRHGDTAVVKMAAEHSLPAAVGAQRVTWNWSARTHSSASFEPVGSSTVTVYTTVDAPHPPWGDGTSHATKIPWQEALDVACEWANGATSVPEVKERTTRAVHRLEGFQYHPRTAPRFINNPGNTFRCDEFIESIGSSSPTLLLCVDVSTIVCTFANLLGADLSIDKMRISDGLSEHHEGTTVPIKGIGWDTPKAVTMRMHEVAWMAPGQEQQPLWDATFGFPEDPAVNETFTDYRKRLMGTSVSGTTLEKRCHPIEPASFRRFVAPPAPITDVQPNLIAKFQRRLHAWTHDWTRLDKLAHGEQRARSLWVQTDLGCRLLVDAIRFSDPATAQSTFKGMVGAEPAQLTSEPDDLWDEAFANAAKVDDQTEMPTVFYLRKREWVARMLSVGEEAKAIRDEAVEVTRVFAEAATSDLP